MATSTIIQFLAEGEEAATSHRRQIETFIAGGTIAAGDWVQFDTAASDADRVLKVIEATAPSRPATRSSWASPSPVPPLVSRFASSSPATWRARPWPTPLPPPAPRWWWTTPPLVRPSRLLPLILLPPVVWLLRLLLGTARTCGSTSSSEERHPPAPSSPFLSLYGGTVIWKGLTFIGIFKYEPR